MKQAVRQKLPKTIFLAEILPTLSNRQKAELIAILLARVVENANFRSNRSIIHKTDDWYYNNSLLTPLPDKLGTIWDHLLAHPEDYIQETFDTLRFPDN